MGQRRGAGEGSIFCYRDGWGAQIDIQQWNQPRRRKTVYGPTRADVVAKLDALRQQQDLGLPIAYGRPVTTGEYLQQWITEILPAEVTSGRLKPSTLASYTDHVRRHIQPAFPPATLPARACAVASARSLPTNRGATESGWISSGWHRPSDLTRATSGGLRAWRGL